MSNEIIDFSKGKVDLSFRAGHEAGIARVEPSLTENGVMYFDQNPSIPELVHPGQIVLPLSDPRVLEWVEADIKAYNSTQPDVSKQRKIGFGKEKDNYRWKKPGVGGWEHCAVINLDKNGNFTSYGFDIGLIHDGPEDKRTEVSRGGTVVAPIEERDGEFYVRCFWKERDQFARDNIIVPEYITDPDMVRQYIATNSGEQMLTVPGGYAKSVSEAPEATAVRRAKELAGYLIDEPVMRKTPWGENRSNSQNAVHLGFSTYRSDGHTITPGPDEIVSAANMAVNIRVFESVDGISQAAVDFAARELILKR